MAKCLFRLVLDFVFMFLVEHVFKDEKDLFALCVPSLIFLLANGSFFDYRDNSQFSFVDSGAFQRLKHIL